MKIPIQNLYYLLCYAWNRLEESDTTDLSRLDSNKSVDLLAKVLNTGTQRLIKRGLDRQYIPQSETLRTVRGRIDMQESVRRFLPRQGKLQCTFDDFRHDVLHNQIIKSTLRRLASTPSIHKNLAADLMRTFRRLPEVSEVHLRSGLFKRVQLHRNNAHYSFLLHICELALECMLMDEKSGHYRFRDFVRDENKMPLLFQHFVRNFYDKEQNKFKVSGKNINWDASALSEERKDDLDFVPRMETDIFLKSDDRVLIVDTKFYKEVFATRYEGTDKFKSGHLYQLYAYLNNYKSEDGIIPEGLLLYPQTSQAVNRSFKIQDFPVHIRTINLQQGWNQIHEDLLSFVGDTRA